MDNNDFQQIAKRLEKHPLVFGRYAFSDTHLRDESPMFHVIVLANALRERKLAIAAPREHAKSTILSFLYIIYCIVFKKKRHIVILQNTLAKAVGTLSSIKYELVHNLALKPWGIEFEKDTREDTVFKHPDGFMIRVLCKGYEQMGSIRGEKFIAWRPDLVIVDDLEDDKSVENPELRAECERIFNDAVDPAVDYKAGGQIIFIGTVLHDDCLIAKVINPTKYLTYVKYRYQARLEDGSSLWEDRFSKERLDEIEAEDPIKFAKEYQNDPISGARRIFHKEDFRYWAEINRHIVLYDETNKVRAKYEWKDMQAAIGCDLAWEEKREADESVIFPALLTPDNDVLLDTPFHDRGVRPDKLADILFDMVAKYEGLTGTYVSIGFEKAKLEKVAKWFLKQEMKKRNKWLILKDIKWDKDKITRIAMHLLPRYSNHTIYHRQKMGVYENQLLRIPSGTHDDLPDAAQNVVQLLKNPRQAKKVREQDDDFEWFRKRLVAKKNPSAYVFGQKKKDTFPIRCEDTLR